MPDTHLIPPAFTAAARAQGGDDDRSGRARRRLARIARSVDRPDGCLGRDPRLLADDGSQDGNDLGREVVAGLRVHDRHRWVEVHRGPIGPIGRQGLPDVRDGDDSRPDRKAGCRQSPEVTAPVETPVMAGCELRGRGEGRDRGQDPERQLGMALDDRELLGLEARRLVEDRIRDAELAKSCRRPARRTSTISVAGRPMRRAMSSATFATRRE